MEALHIATVLKREREESQYQQISASRANELSPRGQLPIRLNSFDICQLYSLFDFESSPTWRQKLHSLCSCQYLTKQIWNPDPPIRALLYCPCLSKYSYLDPDGMIRLNILNYLGRIQSALTPHVDGMSFEDLK